MKILKEYKATVIASVFVAIEIAAVYAVYNELSMKIDGKPLLQNLFG